MLLIVCRAILMVKTRLSNKQVKGGYLLRYRRGFFCKGWCEEWVVLYEDSTIAWYSDKGLSRPRGYIRLCEAPELLAVGEWTRQIPRQPRFPRQCHKGQILAIGSRTFHDVHWLMAQSSVEMNDWMTAINNTLSPPPQLPINDMRLSLTTLRPKLEKACHTNGLTHHLPSSTSINQNTQSRKYEADHTVLSGVCIDWGHGWGWGQAAWATQAACESDVTSSIYCHASDDYSLGGYDSVDWSAFGDFSF